MKLNLKGKQNGFTLVELLVAVAILGAIGGALSTAITYIIRGSDRTKDQAVILQQVQNAGYWISRDVQMAVDVTPGGGGALVTVDQTDGVNDYVVAYVFDGTTLKRQLGGQQTLVAQYIVEGDTSFVDDTEVGVDRFTKYKLTIKASRGEAEVERVYEIAKRMPDESE
ncbi:MAG: type II secretion system protein [Dehalococcoidia bacterium]|nr:type II secretion system protein [Dehalococcoidia bacterium]